MSAKPDPLAAGRKMLESMMAEVQKPPKDSPAVPFEDKLKLLDRWMKFQALELNRKRGGMGGGFDDQGEENEAGDI